MRSAFFPVQVLDGLETTSDNVRGLLPDLFLEAGFEGFCQGAGFNTIFGALQLYGLRALA
jgi:hypothetical protein